MYKLIYQQINNTPGFFTLKFVGFGILRLDSQNFLKKALNVGHGGIMVLRHKTHDLRVAGLGPGRINMVYP